METGMWAVFAWVLGLLLGSFLNVVAYRLPRGESLVSPGSRCPGCGRSLRPWELVPVLSWLVLGGCCRTCRTRIAVRYPVLEMVTGALFAATVWTVAPWPQRLAWGWFWLVLMAAVGTDLTSMRVPNVLSLPGAAGCIGLSGATSVHSWAGAIAGALTGFGVLYLLHLVSRGNMGMGDAKLFLSVGAMLGPIAAAQALVLASFSGAVLGLALRSAGRLRRREPIPFVPHIAVGVVVTVFYGTDLTAWYARLVGG
ncbi:MAG: prepilin peptidase [Alicyclobacillus sp.]|nr:prepilin peptidase [Alicyclobacillus sp.]